MIRAQGPPRSAALGDWKDKVLPGPVALGLLAAGLVAVWLGGPAAVLAVGLLVVVGALVAWYAPELYLVAFLAAGPFQDTTLADTVPVDLVGASAVGLFFATLVTLWRRRGQPLALPGPAAAFLALGALLAVAALHSPDPEAGLAKVGTFVSLTALAFFAPILVLRGRESLTRLALGLVGLGLLVAFIAEHQDHAGHPLVLPGAANEIDVGLLAGMGLVAIIGYLWPLTPGIARVLWLAPAAYLAITVVSAGSRGALAGVIVATVIALALQMLRLTSARVAAVSLLVLVAVAAPIVVATSPPQAQAKYLAVLQGGDGGLQRLDAGGGARSEITSSAVEMFADHPLGVGTAGYPALTGFPWPHNIILELGAELGVLGIGLFLVLLGATLLALARGSLRAGHAPEAIGAVALLLVPLMLSLSSYDLNGNRIMWAMFGVALAVGAAGNRRRVRYLAPELIGAPPMGRLVPVRDRRFVPPSVAAGGFEALLVRGVEALLGVALVIVTARLMEPTGRGLFALASLTAVLCSLPLGSVWSAAAIDVAHRRSSLARLLGACLVIAVVGGVATGLIALSVASLLGDNWWVVAIPAAAVPAILLARYQEGLYQAVGHVRAVNLMTLCRIGAPLALISLALFSGASDAVAVGAWAIGLVVLPLLFWAPLRRLAGGVEVPRERSLYRRLVAVGSTLIIPNSALMLSTRVALIALAIFASTDVVGVYSVAIAAAEVLYLATYSLVSGAFHRIGTTGLATSAAVTARAVRHVVLVTLLGAAALVPAVIVTLPWLIGPGYGDVPWILVGLLPGVVAFAMWWVVQTFFVVHLARPATAVRITTIGLGVNTALTFALVPLLGVPGAIIASVTGNLLIAALGLRRFLSETGLRWSALIPGVVDLRDYRTLLQTIPRKGGSS